MRKQALIIFAVAFLLLGCCGVFSPGNANATAQSQNNTPLVVSITLNGSEGYSPFYPQFYYTCYDPDNDLVSCELKLDGRVFASGTNQDNLMAQNFTPPQWYFDTESQVGNHTIEINATDAAGQSASSHATFSELPSAALTNPGWYLCNNNSNPPCDQYQQFYCDKFDPTDLSVREAASQAIEKHPGAFSINQILDIYDWVHNNIFYQNVPVTKWDPYHPNETLLTKSGDCKNQAVLIASMIEAIGGSARVLLIPDCKHAFAEVYVGNNTNLDALNNAVWAHYPQSSGQNINWHTSKDSDNQTENWFILDTAGGDFPGNTIPDCLNASQTFEMRDCYANGALNTPQVQGTEYGPNVIVNDTQIIEPGNWHYYSYDITSEVPSKFSFCHFQMSVQSISSEPVDWYIMNSSGYKDFSNYQSFRYYYGEEQVYQGGYSIDFNSPDNYYFVVKNGNQGAAITVETQVIMSCYT